MIFQIYVAIFEVAEKSWSKALSIGRHLEISSLLLMSAEITETLTFVSLKFCFLGFVNRRNELFCSYLWSCVHELTSSSTNHIYQIANEERTPTHCSIVIDLRLSFCCAEVYAFKVTHF